MQRQLAEADQTEHERDRDQRESNREADEYRAEQHDERQDADPLGTHSHFPWRAAQTLFRSSETPCTMSNITARNSAPFNG